MIIFAGDIEANGSNVYLNIEELQQQLDTDFIQVKAPSWVFWLDLITT